MKALLARLRGIISLVIPPTAIQQRDGAYILDRAGDYILTREVSAFDPATLFASGEQGAWYDPSDLTTVFTTDAGGNLVPAVVGDDVAQINDKSGNGNHATQATVAARPILRQSGSLYYLEFDGTDDYLTTNNSLINNQEPMSIMFGGDYISDTGTGWLNIDGSIGLADSVAVTAELAVRTGGGFIGWGPPASGNFVYVVTHPGTGRIFDFECYLNGSAKTRTSGTDRDLILGATTTTNFFFSDTVNDHISGNMYAGVFIDREISTSERNDTESYIADKTGVTL